MVAACASPREFLEKRALEECELHEKFLSTSTDSLGFLAWDAVSLPDRRWKLVSEYDAASDLRSTCGARRSWPRRWKRENRDEHGGCGEIGPRFAESTVKISADLARFRMVWTPFVTGTGLDGVDGFDLAES